MKYPVTRNSAYDFAGQSYADSYPNLHPYPATMPPQIGIAVFRELGLQGGSLLDPYCGSGSSLAVGLECDFHEMYGFDLNPLALLISQAKFTAVPLDLLQMLHEQVQQRVVTDLNDEKALHSVQTPGFSNVAYWFADAVLRQLSLLKHILDTLPHPNIRRLFLVAFAETVRDCSYTRPGEFKLYRRKPEDLAKFQPNVVNTFLTKLNKIVSIYTQYYAPRLNGQQIHFDYLHFRAKPAHYDVVLTSPPYGDSRTTVAYGQFSLFANAWLGYSEARRLDARLMGGKPAHQLYAEGVLYDALSAIHQMAKLRALEVSAFYWDLAKSIQQVAACVKPGGKIIYLVGNRRVKNIQLPTDQFIAEQFERWGFRHCFTYERRLNNKVMPSRNSPSNIKGDTIPTMSQEFLVVCEKLP